MSSLSQLLGGPQCGLRGKCRSCLTLLLSCSCLCGRFNERPAVGTSVGMCRRRSSRSATCPISLPSQVAKSLLPRCDARLVPAVFRSCRRRVNGVAETSASVNVRVEEGQQQRDAHGEGGTSVARFLHAMWLGNYEAASRHETLRRQQIQRNLGSPRLPAVATANNNHPHVTFQIWTLRNARDSAAKQMVSIEHAWNTMARSEVIRVRHVFRFMLQTASVQMNKHLLAP